MINNIDFEQWLKERLYDHAEPVDPDRWERVQVSLMARKRRKIIFKRSLYGMCAAAAVLLFLLLRPVAPAQPDAVRESFISLLEPEEVIDSLNEEPVQTVMPSFRMEKRTYTAAIAARDVSEEVEIPVEMPMPDSTGKPAPSPRLDTRRQLDTRYIPEQHTDRYPSKRRYTSDGWSIAMVSTYSSAAGEAPFTPSTQVMSGRTRIYNTADASAINQEQTALSFSPPLSAGINFQKELYPWLSLGLGINYTLLQSKFSNSYQMGDEYTIRQTFHYVGLPVSALFVFVHQPRLRVYASAGGMVEKAVTAYSSSTSKFTRNAENFYVPGLQWSVHAGLGVEVPLFSFFGLYVEPGMGYFFDCKQPRTIRTVQPTQFKAEVGVRVRI